jgi:hypothetical protein
MENYKLLKNGVLRLSDQASIPDCNGNQDWQDYQLWLADGNIPEPIDPDLPSPFDGNLVLTRMATEFSMVRMYALKNSYGIIRDFILFENFSQLKQYINLMLNDGEAVREDYNILNEILKEQGVDLDIVTITSDATVQTTTNKDILSEAFCGEEVSKTIQSDATVQTTSEQIINSETVVSEE